MEQERRKANATDYLANERTFLAWLRTGVGIMAFGFVVVKFSLFVKQISLILDKNSTTVPVQHSMHSSVLGIVLVVLGMLTIIMSYIRYRYTDKQLDNGQYKHSSLFITLLTATIFLISILLVYYLVKTT